MEVLSTPRLPIGLPSPTLTNPDLILPDSMPSTASPSTPRQHQRPPSPPMIDKLDHGRSESDLDERPKVKDAMFSPFRNGVTRRQDGSTRLRSSSERGDSRIALEDNGRSYRQGADVPFASSPTLEEDLGQRIYTESTQGDFENGEGTYTTPAILEEDEDDPNSHAAMTRRAEEILANAKRRLTNMEGNLNRARSTLQSRPSSSMSSFRNRTPEPVSLYTLPGNGRSPGGFALSKHRQARLPNPDETRQGHSRIFSETSVPSSLQTSLPNGKLAGESEETSNGLGIDGADAALRDRHSEPSRNWFWNGLTRDTSLKHGKRNGNGLQALDEDGPAPSFEQRATQEDDIQEENSVDLQSSAAMAFDAKNPPDNSLTRARSTTQMHDLREQMQDLKGKISTLKKKAREDNMRRRSLQSLRTPSPFTDAEQWYTGAKLPQDTQREGSGSEPSKGAELESLVEIPAKIEPQDSGHASLNADHIQGEVDNQEPVDEMLEKDPQGTDEIVQERSNLNINGVNGFPSHKERLLLVVDGPVIDHAKDDDLKAPLAEENSLLDAEAKEDSLFGDQDYHETSTSLAVERHEDRPDAFDYEHFILNSALGTYSGIGVRRSSSKRERAYSQSSECSVETTKPRPTSLDDAPQADAPRNSFHARQNSVDSVSTTNTFATANEGTDSDEADEDWTFGRTRAGARIKAPGIGEGERLPVNGIQKYGSKKHIATAQRGYVNGINRKSPPPEKGASSQPPDLLTVLSTTKPWEEGAPPTKMTLGDRDRELLERLVKSLAKVCSEVQALGPDGSVYEARVFRRKLDAARRVLDGEMNGEAF